MRYLQFFLLYITTVSSETDSNNFFTRCEGDGCRHRHKEGPKENGAPVYNYPGAAKACIPDDKGSFGTNKGKIITIKYHYQVETYLDERSLNANVLGDIEKQVSDSLLPTLFAEKCGMAATIRRSQIIESDVNGVSTFPPDVVSNAACIGWSQRSQNNCFVVDGTATVFLERGDRAAEIRQISAQAIKEAMNAGAIDQIEDGLFTVTYIDEVDAHPPTVPSKTKESDSKGVLGNSSMLCIWVVVGVVGASVAMLVAYKLVHQRNRQNQQLSVAAGSERSQNKIESSSNRTQKGVVFLPVLPKPKGSPSTKSTRNSISTGLAVIAEEDDDSSSDNQRGTTAVVV